MDVHAEDITSFLSWFYGGTPPADDTWARGEIAPSQALKTHRAGTEAADPGMRAHDTTLQTVSMVKASCRCGRPAPPT